MRLLISGTSGLLGLNLALQASQAHQVVGLDRQRLSGPPFELLEADLLGAGAVESALDRARPDWFIHCAALADIDACEADPQLAARLNAALPGQLAAACRPRGIRMLHISTDAVFDGAQERPYGEEDLPAPPSVYARTKREGETAVLSADPDAAVARVNFYGWSMSGRRSLAEFFVNNLAAGKAIKGFTDVRICPMFVGDLAEVLLAMLSKGLHGLYHAVGADCLTKYDFGVAIARRFGLDETLISPDSVDGSGLAARRAHNLQLSVHKLSTDLGGPLPGFSTGLDRFYTQYQQGYPQKIRSYQQV